SARAPEWRNRRPDLLGDYDRPADRNRSAGACIWMAARGATRRVKTEEGTFCRPQNRSCASVHRKAFGSCVTLVGVSPGNRCAGLNTKPKGETEMTVLPLVRWKLLRGPHSSPNEGGGCALETAVVGCEGLPWRKIGTPAHAPITWSYPIATFIMT